MTLIDYLSLILKKVFRNKKNRFYIVITIICSLISLGIFTFYNNMNIYINIKIKNNSDNRSILVPPNLNESDYGFKELSKIKHVIEVYNSKYSMIPSIGSSLKSEYTDGVIGLLYNSDKTELNVIAGENFTKFSKNVLICPMNFYPDRKAFNLNVDKKGLINGENLLGEKITLNFINDNSKERLDEQFEIIGLYDNKTAMKYNNECFAPKKDVIRITEFTNPSSNGSFYSTVVIVDDINNIEYVQKKIKSIPNFVSKDYDLQMMSEIDIKLVKIVSYSCLLILFILILTNVFLTISYTKKKIINEFKVIGVMRNSGYNKKTISKLYFLEILLTNLFSYLVGLIIFITLYFITTNYIFSGLQYSMIDIKFGIFPVVNTLLITLIPCIVVIFYINSKCDMPITTLLSDKE